MGPVVIAIADTTRARIYAQDQRGQPLHFVEEIEHPEGGLRNKDLVTDRPGQQRQGPRGVTFGGAARESPKEHEQRKLAQEIAEHLEKARVSGILRELVLVMGPRMLGAVRRELTSSTEKAIVATIESDIAQLDENGLAAHLKAKWFVPTQVFAR